MRHQLIYTTLFVVANGYFKLCSSAPPLDANRLKDIVAKAVSPLPEYQVSQYETLLGRFENNVDLNLDDIDKVLNEGDGFVKSFVDYVILVTNFKKIQYWIGKDVPTPMEVDQARQDYFTSVALGIGKNCRDLVDRVGELNLDSTKYKNIFEQVDKDTLKWIKAAKVCKALKSGLDAGSVQEESYKMLVKTFPDDKSLFEKYKDQITSKKGN